jgi:hypothetical protein
LTRYIVGRFDGGSSRDGLPVFLSLDTLMFGALSLKVAELKAVHELISVPFI